MSASKARPKPPGLHSRPPEPTRCDHRVAMSNGTTMALELSPSRVQQQKKRQPTTNEDRVVELVKENGVYRREIGFCRGCIAASCHLVDEVYGVSQELMLAYYHNPHLPLDILEEWHRHAVGLQKAIDAYERVVIEMEDEWVNSWKPQEGHRVDEYKDVI